MNAWCKSNSVGSAEMAESILTGMEKRYLSGDDNATPDSISYNTVICAFIYSKEKGSSLKALEIIYRMVVMFKNGNKKIELNVRYFNIVLRGLANDTQDLAVHAENLLWQMEELQEAGIKKSSPNTSSYIYIIKAWIKLLSRDRILRAEYILRHMESFNQDGNVRCAPTKFCYSLIVDAWIELGDAFANEHLSQFLKQMKKVNVSDSVENEGRDARSYNRHYKPRRKHSFPSESREDSPVS